MEHLLLGAIPREATLLSHLQRSHPGVKDVHLSVGGVCRYHLWVQFEKKREGEAKNVILARSARTTTSSKWSSSIPMWMYMIRPKSNGPSRRDFRRIAIWS